MRGEVPRQLVGVDVVGPLRLVCASITGEASEADAVGFPAGGSSAGDDRDHLVGILGRDGRGDETEGGRLPGSSWNFDGDPTGIVMVRR